MKKRIHSIIASVTVLVIFTLTGCLGFNSVDTLNGWSFQYNEGTDDYSLFFELRDRNENALSADATVFIRIINENNEPVYNGTKQITSADFGTYSNAIKGDRYLADIRIAPNEINEGTSANGTVYFKVQGKNFVFDEVKCEAISCLPTKDISITLPDLPIQLGLKDIDGSEGVQLMISNIEYEVDNSIMGISAKFIISGEKISESSDYLGFSDIGVRLYDAEGYLIDSGSVYLDDSLQPGDKFRNESLVIYDLTPGTNYTLQLTEE